MAFAQLNRLRLVWANSQAHLITFPATVDRVTDGSLMFAVSTVDGW